MRLAHLVFNVSHLTLLHSTLLYTVFLHLRSSSLLVSAMLVNLFLARRVVIVGLPWYIKIAYSTLQNYFTRCMGVLDDTYFQNPK